MTTPVPPEPVQMLLDVEVQLIIDLGWMLREAARLGPAGDYTSIQDSLKTKLPDADRRWQHALDELEMQILDAKAVLSRDLERVPKGGKPLPPASASTSAGPSAAPTPVPIKTTPVPPPIIPGMSLGLTSSSAPTAPMAPMAMAPEAPMAPVVTPVPPPAVAAARNSTSPLLMKKEPLSSPAAGAAGRVPKASPALAKAVPAKKASPAVSKAALAKASGAGISKSPAKKASPAISKASPALAKASPALSKSSPALVKSSPALARTSPAITKATLAAASRASPEMGFTNLSFGVAEHKQTPVPPPQIPPPIGKAKQAPKKKAAVVANTAAKAAATIVPPPPPPSVAPATASAVPDPKVSFAPVDGSGDILISDAPPPPAKPTSKTPVPHPVIGGAGAAGAATAAKAGGAPPAPMAPSTGVGEAMAMPMAGMDLLSMSLTGGPNTGMAGAADTGSGFEDVYMETGEDDLQVHDMADFNDEYFKLQS